ncbi:MAG: phosphate signaling complex protein PhoU [Anaerolineae bacterium]|nr:phosphate signaling complex protein PhoU [Anaerolineae bacterium]
MVYQLFGAFDIVLALQIVVKIVLAIVLGGLVGWERERHNMPAGIRTFILVSVGSCIFTILSKIGFRDTFDSARVAAQIVSGIGFLGAGVVMQRKGTVHGLTSAAGIWAIASVGMAVGTGNYYLAIFGSVAIFVVLGLLREVFKARLIVSTQRTLHVELRRVQNDLSRMGLLVRRAISDAVGAVVNDDHDLAQQIVENDAQINALRYEVDRECLDILRLRHPQKVRLRTVMAAVHVATNLERIGDYAKRIAQIRLQMGHQPLLQTGHQVPDMAEEICEMLEHVVSAFAQDDVEMAKSTYDQANQVQSMYEDIVEQVTEKMSEKKTRHFERGAQLLQIAYHLNRASERVTNIAEQIVFVRTGALAEIDSDELGQE